MADEMEQTADVDQFSDAYQDYITRKRAAEAETLGETKTLPSMGGSGYLFRRADQRTSHIQGSRSSGPQLQYSKHSLLVEGPTLPNHLHYRAHVWPLWRVEDPKEPPQYLTNFGIYYILALTLVGLVLIPILLALDLLWHFLRRPALERRFQEALNDSSRPWAWTVSRSDWLYATVPIGSYPLRHPERCKDKPDWCIFEQVEDSKEAALDGARRAVAWISR